MNEQGGRFEIFLKYVQGESEKSSEILPGVA